MSTDPYFPDPNHARLVVAALDEFHRVLTSRWREEICHGIVSGGEFSMYLRSDGASADHPVLSRARVLAWDHTSTEARRHLEAGTCAYLKWVDSGQQEPLNTVICDGLMQPDPFGPWDPNTGDDRRPPGYTDCGMGRILEQVEDWAWEERQHVFAQVPLFDSHDLHVLRNAHDTFIQVGARLGLVAADNSDPDVAGLFNPVSSQSLPEVVRAISSHSAYSPLWWDKWTGLAAAAAKDGFFASVEPTLVNQAGFLGSVANLYSERAAIIDAVRNNTLGLIQWATKSLDETAPIDYTDTWLAVQGVGTGVSIFFGWSVVGSVAGSFMTLFGFIGQYLLPRAGEAYKQDMAEIVRHLNGKVAELNRELDVAEVGYGADVTLLCERIHGVHSYNLELYDLTQNDPDKDRPTAGTGSVTMDVEEVLGLAEKCYTAGELYADLLPPISRITDAAVHLADENGYPTRADQRLLEARDQIEEYLRTSAGRYLVAADQVTKAARLFVEIDTEQKENFEEIMADWETRRVGQFDLGFDPIQSAQATERPWLRMPDRATGAPYLRPGWADPGRREYVTDTGAELE